MGSGCAGAVQMNMIASSLLKDGGTMTAPMSYAFTKGSNPFALTGYRTLDLLKGNSQQWGLSTVASMIYESDPSKVCKDDATKLVKDLKAEKLLPEKCRENLLTFGQFYIDLFSKKKWQDALSILGDEKHIANIETFLSIQMFKKRYKVLCGIQ